MKAGFEPGHIFRVPTSLREKALGVGGQSTERLRLAPGGTYLDATGHLRTLPSDPKRSHDAITGVTDKLAARQTALAAAAAKRKRPRIPADVTGKDLTRMLERLGYKQAHSMTGGLTFTLSGKPTIHFAGNDVINVRNAKPEVKAAIREFFERGLKF